MDTHNQVFLKYSTVSQGAMLGAGRISFIYQTLTERLMYTRPWEQPLFPSLGNQTRTK